MAMDGRTRDGVAMRSGTKGSEGSSEKSNNIAKYFTELAVLTVTSSILNTFAKIQFQKL